MHGHFLVDNPRLYRRILRIARFIEYGGALKKKETRETLIECKKRPKGSHGSGRAHLGRQDRRRRRPAHCVVCSLHNWQETEWADGMMGAVAIALEAERPSTH